MRNNRNQISFFCFLFLGMMATAQDFETVDATIQFYPKNFNQPQELSAFISRDFTLEEEKVRAIYGWIIHNVVYDPDEYSKFNYNFKNYRERNQKEENTRKKVIQRTLQTGKAVCEGYSMLFEKLCELQGIQSYLVRGDVKNNFNDIGRSFKKVHMWNVAYIDGQPFLFDPTWGAGRFNEVFIKEPSYYYFKAQPDLFIKSHYPDLIDDAFLSVPLSKQLFSQLPLVIKQDLRLNDLMSPSSGIIVSSQNLGSIKFRLKSEQPNQITYSYGLEKEAIQFTANHGVIEFTIPAVANKNLLVYFDDLPALGYKVK